MFTLIRINRNHRNHMIIATSTFSKRSVFKMFCSLRATSLGGGGTEGGENTLQISLLRATRPERASSMDKCFATTYEAQSLHFQMIYSFQDGVFEKITPIRWNRSLKLAKRCLLSLNVISGLIRSPPPPSPAVYNLLLTREEGTICS